MCLICHEDKRKNGGGVPELHCMHRFHKEVKYHIQVTTDTLRVSSTMCLHCPGFSIVNRPLLVHSGTGMPEVKSLLLELAHSWICMIESVTNNPPSSDTHFCVSMAHANSICPVLRTKHLMIMMSPYGGH